MADVAKRMVEGETGITEYTYKGVRKIIAFAPVGLNGWSIGATQDESEFLAAAVAIRKANIIAALVAGVIMAGLIMLAATSMIKPINAAVAGLKDIAKGEGNLSMRLQATSHNEIGELSRWFNVFIEKLQGIIKEISKGVHILHSSSSTLSAISEEMNHKIKDVSSRHNLLSTAAEEMSTAINNVAASMGQSAVNVNGVAMSSKEMSKTISEIAQNTENARMISETALQKASNASANIDELGHAARAIGNVIDTITDISEQVNLLALNATIEAARAGESGRGFAVVANEIKELANQTAHATDEIKTKIRSIQKTTSITIEQINDITKVIKGVNEAVGNIATAVELQNSATKEIAVNVSQASEGIQDVNESVDQISTAASGISKDTAEVNNAINEMSKDSAQVSLSSQDLLTLSEKLEHMVKQFKGA
jgi:methyl-accepting chemotaxis protein